MRMRIRKLFTLEHFIADTDQLHTHVACRIFGPNGAIEN